MVSFDERPSELSPRPPAAARTSPGPTMPIDYEHRRKLHLQFVHHAPALAFARRVEFHHTLMPGSLAQRSPDANWAVVGSQCLARRLADIDAVRRGSRPASASTIRIAQPSTGTAPSPRVHASGRPSIQTRHDYGGHPLALDPQLTLDRFSVPMIVEPPIDLFG